MRPSLLLAIGVLSILLGESAGVAFQEPDVDRQLEDAQRLYRDANFTEAVIRLQGAIDRLKLLQDLQSRKGQLVDAHLLLALSYFALDERGLAKEHLKDIVRLDPARRLDPRVYAPPVLQLIEEARAEIAREQPVVRPARSSSAPVAAPAKSRSKALIIALGVAGAGAAGAAVVAGGDSGPLAESGAVSVSPSGIALVAITDLTFTSSGFRSAPTWTFGDGSRATGATVTHTYSTEGTFDVTAQTAASAATVRVIVRSLTGTWVNDVSPDWRSIITLTQVGTRVVGTVEVVQKSGLCCHQMSSAEGSIMPPRNLILEEHGACMRTLSLAIAPDASSMSGSSQHRHPSCPPEPFGETYLRQ